MTYGYGANEWVSCLVAGCPTQRRARSYFCGRHYAALSADTRKAIARAKFHGSRDLSKNPTLVEVLRGAAVLLGKQDREAANV